MKTNKTLFLISNNQHLLVSFTQSIHRQKKRQIDNEHRQKKEKGSLKRITYNTKTQKNCTHFFSIMSIV
jgi:hypothetical protein